MKLTYGFDYSNVIGEIELSDTIEEMLIRGDRLELGVSFKEVATGSLTGPATRREVIGASLFPIPAAPTREEP